MHARQHFYAGRQLEGEDFCDFSHALSQLLNSALQQSHNAVSDPHLALRDQFIEVIRDMTLRRELHKLVREKPQSTLFDVREEAMMWVVEDRPRGANLARTLGRHVLGRCQKIKKPVSSAQSDIAVA